MWSFNVIPHLRLFLLGESTLDTLNCSIINIYMFFTLKKNKILTIITLLTFSPRTKLEMSSVAFISLQLSLLMSDFQVFKRKSFSIIRQ